MQTMTMPGQGAQPMMAGPMPNNNMQGQAMPQGGAQGQAVPQMQPVMGPNGQPLIGANGMPVMQPAPVVQVDKSGGAVGLIKTIAIIVLSLMTVTFIGLFVWKQIEFATVEDDIEGRIAAAEQKAKLEQGEEDLAKFAEEEKNPFRDFAGPADYGQLSFKYPKTWSVYVAKDASNGGDYEAYFNPLVVNTVSDNTVNSLRVVIRDKSFDEVVAEYQRALERKDSGLSMSTVDVNGITMNRYTGVIPNTNLNGVFVVFKIRDKTAILQTDAEQFVGDFDALLQTITFNA